MGEKNAAVSVKNQTRTRYETSRSLLPPPPFWIIIIVSRIRMSYRAVHECKRAAIIYKRNLYAGRAESPCV